MTGSTITSAMPVTPVLKPIHPFPARMAPAILWNELPDATTERLTVLDPMTGSGTTIAAARLRGHQALGFDTDPLSVLIARAWSMNVRPDELREMAEIVLETARFIYADLSAREAYPHDSDEETQEFVRYWFDVTSRRQLTALASAIDMARPARIRPLLWVALSRTIIVKSAGVSLAMDVAHSRPHRVYETSPVKPFDAFPRAVMTVAKNSPFCDGKERPAACVSQGDARKLPLEDCSVDLVITSPPYLNAIDYLRGHRLSLVWMGHCLQKLRTVRSTNVGSELSQKKATEEVEAVLAEMGHVQRLSGPDQGMLRRYVGDLRKVIAEMSRVLKRDGHALVVVGDSSLSGTFIKNSVAITSIGRSNGLDLVEHKTRPLPENKRYLPPPESMRSGTQLRQRMRDEVILKFRKAG